jgi:hypothetical protein
VRISLLIHSILFISLGKKDENNCLSARYPTDFMQSRPKYSLSSFRAHNLNNLQESLYLVIVMNIKLKSLEGYIMFFNVMYRPIAVQYLFYPHIVYYLTVVLTQYVDFIGQRILIIGVSGIIRQKSLRI